MANSKIPSGVLFEKPPAILLWMPEVTTPGTHPSWTTDADKLRDPPYRAGRLLPNLINWFSKSLGFNFDHVDRICAIGFSAGANNGLRELLRNKDDRERLDVLLSVDGMHPNLAPVAGATIESKYADWQKEMEPFADFATASALGERLAVFTASDVAAPAPTNAKTANALADLVHVVQGRVSPWVDPLIPPGVFPSASSSPKPSASAGCRGFDVFWYAGKDKQAHITQGTKVVADLWRDFLAWRWSPATAASGAPGPVSSSTPPASVVPAKSSSAPARVAQKGFPWVPVLSFGAGLVGVVWSVTR